MGVQGSIFKYLEFVFLCFAMTGSVALLAKSHAECWPYSKGESTRFVILEFPSKQTMLYDVSAFSRALMPIQPTLHTSQSFLNYHVFCIYTFNTNIDSMPIYHKLNRPIYSQ